MAKAKKAPVKKAAKKSQAKKVKEAVKRAVTEPETFAVHNVERVVTPSGHRQFQPVEVGTITVDLSGIPEEARQATRDKLNEL
jgi:hypothetical protein